MSEERSTANSNYKKMAVSGSINICVSYHFNAARKFIATKSPKLIATKR